VYSCNGCRTLGALTGHGRHAIAQACPLPEGQHTGKDPTNRGKLGTKRHIVVDRNGALLAVAISGSHVHDSKRRDVTVDAIRPLRLPGKDEGSHATAR
jgi:hypothetical protein